MGELNLVSNTLTVNYSPNVGECNNPENLALGRPATQSGTQQNGPADRAVDGNTDGVAWQTNSVSITNWVQNAYWEVDLESINTIDEIRIWNREEIVVRQTLNNYHVFISNNPFNSAGLDATINQPGVIDLFQSTVAARPSVIPVNQSGRYVRIQLSGSSFLGTCRSRNIRMC